MKWLAAALVFACLPTLVSAQAQDKPPSTWGVAVGIVPEWKTTGNVETIATLIFDAEKEEIDLRGNEFRIGLARGRRLAGDWTVSFIQKTFADDMKVANEVGSQCGGGSFNPNQPRTTPCSRDYYELTSDDARLIGIEVAKFIAFVTIKEKVQIGMNIAGGVGFGRGGFTRRDFRETYSCSYAANQFPFMNGEEDICGGGVFQPGSTTQTSEGPEPFEHILREWVSKRVPIGKLELAGSFTLAPRIKVRVTGGMDFPGTTAVAVSGLYFFGNE